MKKTKKNTVQGSILHQEISSQPDVLASILDKESAKIRKVAARVRAFDPQLILVVARGSADNAGLYGKYLFGACNRKVVALATPSLITRYHTAPDLGRALVLAVSQSGESFDVVETVEAAKRSGALCLAVTNSAKSPLAQVADEVLLCHAGPERSVAATKTYTAQLLLLALLSSAMAEDKRRWTAVQQVHEKVRQALLLEDGVAQVAQRLRYLDHCAVIGRGYCYGSAFELALKLEELTYMVAQPYSSADFRHGPFAVVDRGFCVLMLAPRGKVLPDMQQLVEELNQREAEVIAFSDHKGLVGQATRGFALPPGVPEWLAPLICIIPGQLLAMHLCHAKALPLDTPRGLAKITRTL